MVGILPGDRRGVCDGLSSRSGWAWGKKWRRMQLVVERGEGRRRVVGEEEELLPSSSVAFLAQILQARSCLLSSSCAET